MTLIWTMRGSSELKQSESTAYSRDGRKQDYPTRRLCTAVSSVSTHCMRSCSDDKLTMMASDQQNNLEADHHMPSWREVFLYFLFLGFVNVGGPVAQITMMFNHMVEKRQWLSRDRFIKIMAFCHMLPGPEALQLAIYVGYLKRKVWGGVLAGMTFILPGAVVMVALSWLYVHYGRLPQVTNALYVLKPAVLGIIAAGIIKLGRAAIRNAFLAVLLVGAFVGMRFAGINFLLILLIAGLLNLIAEHGWPLLKKTAPTLPAAIGAIGLAIP